jgi:hypothetical protein
MAVRAVVFDIGGVLEVPTDTNLDGRWERRLGLRPGKFFDRLRRSGLGRDANLGRISEADFAQALGRLYGLDESATEELLAELWDWYSGELNTEMADYFQRLRPRYRTPILRGRFAPSDCLKRLALSGDSAGPCGQGAAGWLGDAQSLHHPAAQDGQLRSGGLASLRTTA